MTDEKKIEAAKHIAIGAGIGFVVGAVVAVLWSPKSGKEVRASITKKIQNIKEKHQQSKVDAVHKNK